MTRLRVTRSVINCASTLTNIKNKTKKKGVVHLGVILKDFNGVQSFPLHDRILHGQRKTHRLGIFQFTVPSYIR